jgi:WD40 repeat protein
MIQEPSFESREDSQARPFNLELLAKLEGSTGPIYSLDWSPDSQLLATAGFGQVKLWDARLYQEIHTLPGLNSFIWGLAWSPDGAALASASQDGSVKLWKAVDWHTPANLAQGAWAFCLAWSPDGKRLAVGTGSWTDETRIETFSGGSQIWDLETHQLLRECRVGSLIISTAWSPDGRTVAIGGLDGKLTLWNGVSDKTLRTFQASHERCDINGLAWAPDGRLLATAHQDSKLRLWNPETGEILQTLVGHSGMLRGVSWSPDGRMLASAGGDGEIRVWDTGAWQLLASLPTEALPVWSLKWSPDGKRLAAGNGLFGDEGISSKVYIFRTPLE